MANRILSFDENGVAKFVSAPEAEKESVPVKVDVVPVDDASGKTESVAVKEVLPEPPSEPNRSKPEHSGGKRRKKAKEQAARDIGPYRHIAISFDVFQLFSMYKNMWAVSDGRCGSGFFSHSEFLKLVLEEFARNKKLF